MAQPASNKGKFIQRLPEKPERLLVLKQKDHVPACLPLMDTGGPPTQHPGSGLPGGQGRAGAGGAAQVRVGAPRSPLPILGASLVGSMTRAGAAVGICHWQRG